MDNMVDQTPETAFRVLANGHRRRLLLALLEHNPQADVTVRDDVRFDDEGVEDLRVELYHQHLPMLERLGVIEWDRGTHSVSKGPNFDEIRPLLELFDRHRGELPAGWL